MVLNSAVKEKLSGFGSHIVVTKHNINNSFETSPIHKDIKVIQKLAKIKGVKNVQSFAIKAGLVKTETETFGVILKGVGSDFDWSFFDANMVKGGHFSEQKNKKTGKDIIISEEFSKIAKVDTGEYLYIYFIEEPAV